MNQRRVWAPLALNVELIAAERRIAMKRETCGWWAVELDASAAQADYAFSVNGGEPRPDPRSPWQPNGVFGYSRPVDHSSFRWTDDGWRQPDPGVIYECHVGTFTVPGTFDAAIARIDYLRDLGVTHVELMPVAEFPGLHGWGYDGVDLYAPHHAYGGPDAMKGFVDSCHRAGLAVILDVVYNHLGPSGNFLQTYGPYLTGRYRTPWGDAINLDGEYSDGVRRFLCDNALMWLRDYHVDGLRLDAVHAIFDSSTTHFLAQLESEVRALSIQLGRKLLVIAESSLNDPRLVEAPEAGGYGLDAQWSDDFHHAIHACLTGETSAYYQDFGSLGQVAKSLSHPYVYDGIYSRYRKRRHGSPASGLAANRFIVCTQNHDQIGNRAGGERLGHLTSTSEIKIAAALLMCSPFTPLIFQGEEWNASTPFLYFEDHQEPELIAAISEGRTREFAHFLENPGELPDSHAPATFARSKLIWNERERGDHGEIFDWYRELIAIRADHEELRDPRLDRINLSYDEAAKWLRLERGAIMLACNLGDVPCTVPLSQVKENPRVLLASSDDIRFDAQAVLLPASSVVIAKTT